MIINFFFLTILIILALWTVLTVRLIRSVVGLALVSAVLSVLMYRLNSPLAAVFELSVCAGLISVIFITTVSFTQRISKEELRIKLKKRLQQIWFLPFILILACWLLIKYFKIPQFNLVEAGVPLDVRHLLWSRHLDLFGQVIVLLAGVFGVVILFKEPKE